jgi:hypothetical protein
MTFTHTNVYPPPPPTHTHTRAHTHTHAHTQGESACTFIAAVCALSTVWQGAVPSPVLWSDMIRIGVEAFHLCTSKELKIDGPQHKNVAEVLPFVAQVRTTCVA